MSYPQGSHQFDAGVSQVEGLEHPELLRATKIRHTKSYLVGPLELDHTTMESFFDHMGHDDNINKHVYRAPPALREIKHMAPLLTSLEGKL